MGFTINANCILRYEISEPLEVGKEYSFEKDGLNLIADDIQIWLARKDWTALADIQITSQQRKDNKTTGTFIIKYLYQNEEQRVLTAIFRRMYGWQ